MTKPLIAVVDGAAEFLEFMHVFLTDQGYQTILCSAGLDAFEMIVREQPDLVILDLLLEHPKAGEMVLGLMRVDPATSDIPVLIVTTDPRLSEYGFNIPDQQCRILVKPYDLHELHVLLQTMLHPSATESA